MAEVSESVSSSPPSSSGLKYQSAFRCILKGIVILGIIAVILGALLGPDSHPLYRAMENAAMQNANTIGICMFQYSVDHGGAYPEGKSSTEVFQKLVDEKYITDPAIFYVRMPGKTRATSDKLKSENVSWDVTIPMDSNSPDGLPLVFLTGYKVMYAPGGSAIPLFKSSDGRLPGMAVCYKSNSAQFMKNGELPNGAIPNFIPSNFDLAGKKFQQLTPEGPLSP
jgi:hypothetical protein